MTILTIVMGSHLVVNGLTGNSHLEEVDSLTDIKRLGDILVRKYLRGDLQVYIPHLPEGEQVVCLLPDSSNWIENQKYYGCLWSTIASNDGVWWNYILSTMGYSTDTFSIPVASKGMNDWALYSTYQYYLDGVAKNLEDIRVLVHYDTPDVLKVALINWGVAKGYPVLYWDTSIHQEVNI